MIRVAIVVIWTAWVSGIGCAAPRISTAPAGPEIDAVLAYVQSHPLESFQSGYAAAKVRGAVAIDIDEDGSTEVFVWIEPRYLQSPTISIFSVLPDGTVLPLAQSLAPGPLHPNSGTLIDSHTLGLAVDFTAEGEDRDRLIETSRDAALDQSTHLVAYRTFLHMDMRGGNGSFLDMTSVNVSVDSCAGFEFSRIEAISAGMLRGRGNAPYFLAAVGDSIYAYRIVNIDDRGLFKSDLLVLRKPSGFVSFAPPESGQASYQTSSGVTEPIR